MKILTAIPEVEPYLLQVRSLADLNRQALGFLPISAYSEQAQRGRLWVAAEKNTGRLLGFLLFGGRFPSLKIFQVFVSPLDRKNGVASCLIERLVSFGEMNGYLSISARVAADLPANNFWGKVGFQIARQDAGGHVTQRRINLRVRDLNTPSLFGKLEANEMLAVGKVSDVHYSHSALSPDPVYVLDLNVFLDVVKNRIYRKDASFLIQARLNHQARVCVTPECAQELARHTNKSSDDPVLEFAKEIPTLPAVGQAVLVGLVCELRTLVFPGSATTGQPSANIESDLTHLAYCVHHRATGFVTRDKGILRAAEVLRKAHSLEVLSPRTFSRRQDWLALLVRLFAPNTDREIFVSLSPPRRETDDPLRAFSQTWGSRQTQEEKSGTPGRVARLAAE